MDLSRYPVVLKDLIEKGAEAIVSRLGISQHDARLAAFLLVEIIRKDWAGTNLYLAKGLSHDILQRDREMYAKFTGANHAELAREYNLTVRHVYERLALVGEEEFKRRQPGLFENSG